jgi:hypothetical protein
MLLAVISTTPLSWTLPPHFTIRYEMTPLNGAHVNGNTGTAGKQNFRKSSGSPATAPKSSKALIIRRLLPE